MKKLLLDPEDLRVETFTVAPAPTERGTVRGRSVFSENERDCSFVGPNCTDHQAASIYSEDERGYSAIGPHCTDVQDP